MRNGTSVERLWEEEKKSVRISKSHGGGVVSTAFVLNVLLETVAPFIITATSLAVPWLVVVVLVDDVLLLKTLKQLFRRHDLGAVAG